MNQHSATNYLKPTRWVSEWLYDKLTLVNSVSGELTTSLSGEISSVQANSFYKAPSSSGILQFRNSSGNVEQIAYSSYTESSGTYTFTVSDTLENTFSSGDRCSAGDSVISDWNVSVYTGTSQSELGQFIPELELPAAVISSGGFSLDSGRDMEMSVLILTESSSNIDAANYEAQNLVDNALEILDWAYEDKLLCIAQKCSPLDLEGQSMTAFEISLEVTEKVRYK
jgi:hypothetical protein